MEIQKKWAMPSGDTFGIKPIKELFDKYNKGGVIIDPFAKDCKLGTIRNDLNPNCDTQYHLDALKFLQGQKSTLLIWYYTTHLIVLHKHLCYIRILVKRNWR